MTWRVIRSVPLDAAYNMAIDEAVAIAVMEGKAVPTLRFYSWKTGSISLGAFQRADEVNLEYCRAENIPLVRRPTGGRAILHGSEITYSFSSPNQPPFDGGLLETYKLIGGAFHEGFSRAGLPVRWKGRRERGHVLSKTSLCFQSVSYGEITLNDRKVMGSAQKRWKDGFLQQGSIQLTLDYDGMMKAFPGITREGIEKTMVGIREVMPEFEEERLILEIIRSFAERFGVTMEKGELSTYEISVAERLLSEKYGAEGWTFRR